LKTKILLLLLKNALTYCGAGAAAVNLKVVGLGPGFGKRGRGMEASKDPDAKRSLLVNM
jgi:hypothetical protein